MNKTNSGSVEIVNTIQRMNVGKNTQSFGLVPKDTIALGKGTETNNVLRNNIIKNEIESAYKSPILCLKSIFMATLLVFYLDLFNNYE